MAPSWRWLKCPAGSKGWGAESVGHACTGEAERLEIRPLVKSDRFRVTTPGCTSQPPKPECAIRELNKVWRHNAPAIQDQGSLPRERYMEVLIEHLGSVQFEIK